MNDLMSHDICITADEWEEIEHLHENASMQESDDAWMEHAGFEFDRIVAIAESRELDVERYIETVMDRREELMFDLFAARNEFNKEFIPFKCSPRS